MYRYPSTASRGITCALTGRRKDPRRPGVIGDMDPVHASTPADLRARLGLLALERDAARRTQLSEDNPYMTDLHDEIAEVEHAYVCSAVAAIAELRADLGGRLRG